MIEDQLKRLREDKKLLQKDIAEYLGITPSAYGFYESGRCEPDLKTLNKLADFHGVSVDFLLGRKTFQTDTSDGIKEPSKDEYKLLTEYRKLNLPSQKAVRDLIESLKIINQTKIEQSSGEEEGVC